jgi:hypothetical protein
MAWGKKGYYVNQPLIFSVPDWIVEDCVFRAGTNKINAIKNLRDASRCKGPFGVSIFIGLKDAKEIIEDYYAEKHT